MTGTIYFNGTSSDDFGLIVEKLPPSVHASRRGDLISIPGRNGVIVREDGSFDTYEQEYQISFSQAAQNRDPYQTARDIAVWLLGSRGFCRLEDIFEPEYFRLARYSGAFDVGTMLMKYGKATLTFDVQPQRYLKSGETPISYEGDSTTSFAITNPTRFEARPLLKFIDTSTEPPIVPQTLVDNDDTYIDVSGEVENWKAAWEGQESPGYVTCEPVSVTGYAYAFVTGNSYAFYDENDHVLSFVPDYYKAQRVQMNNVQVIIPAGASTVVIGSEDGKPSMALSLKAARPNPGVAAVTINGTTVNLDFSAHDTIYLDCDLHDAYYIDGSNANAAVSFASNVTDYPTFPGLAPGLNTIIPGDGSNLDFELTPRWWTL